MSTAKEWQAATPKGKKLPERVGDAKPDLPTKEAFIRAVTSKAAAEGVKPTDLPAYFDKIAAVCKQAIEPTTLAGQAIGGLASAPFLGLMGGLGASAGVGYGLGGLVGGAANRADEHDSKLLRISALANAYRQRAALAKTNSQVRELVASDPSKYMVVG